MTNIRTHFFAICLVFLAAASVSSAQDESSRPKNVIFFVADGAGPAYYTMARDFERFVSGRDHLFIDSYLTGTLRTYSTDSRVTDSAAGATSFASGIKTYNGAIGVDTLERPVLTVLEAAERAGLATGLVVTSRITHATPASFSAHVPDRAMEAEIAVQQIAKEIEVIFGGGRQYYLPESAGGARADELNLLDEASRLGYVVANDLTSFRAVDRTPVLSLFTMSHMSYDIDRDSLTEPSLAEMTEKALELLDGSPEGFFLVVEASRVDHAGHVNDAASAVRDMLAYDRAFQVAVEFAEQNGETLVIATADHDTGGLALGRAHPPEDVPLGVETFWRALLGQSRYEWIPDVLRSVQASAGSIATRLQDRSLSAEPVFRGLAGLDELTEAELLAVEFARDGHGNLETLIGEMVSRRAGIGWTSGGHTAVDVNLYAFGPRSERFRGNLDNDVIGQVLLKTFGSDVMVLEIEPGS